MAARRRVAGQRACRGRREQNFESTLSSKEGGGVGREQSTAREGIACHRPVASQLDQQGVCRIVRAVPERDLRIVGKVETLQRPAREQEVLAPVEINCANEDRALVAGCRVDRNVRGHVVGLHLEDRDRCLERRVARPALDHARVARARHRARPEIGADVHRVGIRPIDFGLRLGEAEAAPDENLVDRVELAHHGRIGPAARERDKHAGVRRRQGDSAAPDPVLAFRGAERVEVEHGLPDGFGKSVFVERGAAPDAALVVSV